MTHNDKRRLKLSIAYDGLPWQGWQSQPNGESVQDQMQRAASVVAKMPVSVEGSGRTDAGVHALAQVAHCDVPASLRMAPHNWVKALNAVLPPSIRVQGCEFAAPDFHARFQARHVYGPLDLDQLRRCAQRLIGTNNFVRLSANRGDLSEEARREDPEVTTRTIHRVDFLESPDVLTFEIEGSGFLYKMVRMITGSLIQVARGRDSEAWFADLLDNPAGTKTNQCALPDGLYLAQVKY